MKPYLLAIAAVALVAVIGGGVTDIGPWYFSLEQPRWKPPDWAFGPVWTTIYVCVVLSVVPAWQQGNAAQRRNLLTAYAVNGVLNVLWSVLFFSLKRPDWALVEIGFLWLSVASLLVVSRHRLASVLLLLPYITWVSVASALNVAIVQLNGPFTATRNVAGL
jgi:translocator protein